MFAFPNRILEIAPEKSLDPLPYEPQTVISATWLEHGSLNSENGFWVECHWNMVSQAQAVASAHSLGWKTETFLSVRGLENVTDPSVWLLEVKMSASSPPLSMHAVPLNSGFVTKQRALCSLELGSGFGTASLVAPEFLGKKCSGAAVWLKWVSRRIFLRLHF